MSISMSNGPTAALSLTAALMLTTAAHAAAPTIGPVFYIALENHNWTQPTTYTGTQAVKGNAAAPFINSMVTPGNANATYTSYTSNYYNVKGTGVSDIHPSEPNYIWHEAGTNFGVANDNDPYSSTTGKRSTAQATTAHISGLLQANGINWKSYQEGTDLLNSNGQSFNQNGGTLTNTVAGPTQYTVPLTSFSGSSSNYTNQYNGTHQYNYADKHNPQVFFDDTSGADGTLAGYNRSATNTMSGHYAPLESLQSDLDNNTVAPYNWITPDQYNDMHSTLSGGFTYKGTAFTGDAASIAQGDNFLSILVPKIMASDAFQNQNGTIVIWNDECEGDNVLTNTQYTSTEIVISKLAKGNAYNSTIAYDHSSDTRTLQELFNVGTSLYAGNGFVGGASAATDLSDLFVAGAVPNSGVSVIPEPATLGLAGLGVFGVIGRRRRAK